MAFQTILYKKEDSDCLCYDGKLFSREQVETKFTNKEDYYFFRNLKSSAEGTCL
jgi:hypothetical protein